MSSSPDNFDQLRRMLACKRYEKPPPRYFNHFSDRVIARIEVEESRGRSDWWRWLLEKFEAKPILACAYGIAVSSLVLVGFRLSEILEQELAEAPPSSGLGFASIPNQPAFPAAFGNIGLSEHPAVAYSTSLSPAFRQEPLVDFYHGSGLRVQAAGFVFGR